MNSRNERAVVAEASGLVEMLEYLLSGENGEVESLPWTGIRWTLREVRERLNVLEEAFGAKAQRPAASPTPPPARRPIGEERSPSREGLRELPSLEGALPELSQSRRLEPRQAAEPAVASRREQTEAPEPSEELRDRGEARERMAQSAPRVPLASSPTAPSPSEPSQSRAGGGALAGRIQMAPLPRGSRRGYSRELAPEDAPKRQEPAGVE